MLGLELAGGVADPADGRAERVGDAEPGRRQRPSERAKSVATGPGPLRTARGAGRFDLLDERLDDEDLRRVWLPDDRDRELPELLLAFWWFATPAGKTYGSPW